MKLVVQRVSEAKVSVDEKVIGSIGRGLLVFLCIEKGDSVDEVEHYSTKVVELRIFGDEAGKMNRSVREVGGEILLISQFTLAADVERGRRPGFDQAAPSEVAEKFYEQFARLIEEKGIRCLTGIFRAYMKVSLINDGPVTIILGRTAD